ncbi:MAG TPA: hypothetical protein VMU53_04880 [Candidatus Sulfotelmatobacter sp.]|nr:hypothetical protein [Candidatus Sulfotelmatobacter sp.]
MSPTVCADSKIEQFEKEARNFLHDLRRREATAIRRYFSFDPQAGNSQPGLADARYVVARRHGFRSWRELKERGVSRSQVAAA